MFIFVEVRMTEHKVVNKYGKSYNTRRIKLCLMFASSIWRSKVSILKSFDR